MARRRAPRSKAPKQKRIEIYNQPYNPIISQSDPVKNIRRTVKPVILKYGAYLLYNRPAATGEMIAFRI